MQADLALNMQDAHAQASATFNTSRPGRPAAVAETFCVPLSFATPFLW